jgi:hypothetical protein
MNENNNNKFSGAEPISMTMKEGGGLRGFIEGDLINDATDVDHFTIDISQAAEGDKLDILCGAQRWGSGLQGFVIELFTPDGSALPLPNPDDAMETPTNSPSAVDVIIPPGAKEIVLKVSAAAQNPEVTSSFYQCGVYIRP